MIPNILIFSFCLASLFKNLDNRKYPIEITASRISKIPEITMQSTSNDDFHQFWHRFSTAIKHHDYAAFKAMSLPYLKYRQSTIPTAGFIKSEFGKLFDKALIDKLADSARLAFNESDLDDSYFDPKVKRLLANPHLVTTVNITKISTYPDGPVIIVLEFVPTKTGYKFLGYDVVGG
jgi:hypothetical protein